MCISIYFFQITIYSDGSLADEIWWTFYERTNWPSRKTSNMDYEFFSSFFIWILNLSIVNTDQESTHECNFFADDPGKL
jgi:hypothetical protein